MRAPRAIWVGFLANYLKRRANGKLLLSLIGNPPMLFDRRHLLRVGGAAAIASGTLSPVQAQAPQQSNPRGTPPQPAGAALDGVPDHAIRIGTGLIELGPDATISTKLYNGQFPGPLLRLTEGKRVVIDIHNDTECEVLQASKPRVHNGLEPRIRYSEVHAATNPCGFVAALGRRCRVAHNSTGPT